MKNELVRLVKELKETKALANTDLEAVPSTTKSSMTSMVRDAQERVQALQKTYTSKVRASSVGFFLFGDPGRAAKFAQVAADEAAVLPIKGDDLYQRLAAKVEPSLGAAREFGPTQLQGLVQELRDIADRLNVSRMATPLLNDMVAVPTREDNVAYCRQLVQRAVGHDLLRVFIDSAVNDAALEASYDGKVLPVAITDLEPDEAVGLTSLFTNTFSVEVGTSEDEEITEDYVLSRLADFRKKITTKPAKNGTTSVAENDDNDDN